MIFAVDLESEKNIVSIWVDPDGAMHEMAKTIVDHPRTLLNSEDIGRLLFLKPDAEGRPKYHMEYTGCPGRQFMNGSTVFYGIIKR